MQQPLAYIPSPSRGLIHLGPLPLRGYALMIILGVVVAVWLSERRWAARGGTAGTAVDIAVWAVPFGLVGGRLYHVITDYQLYFGKDPHIARVFEVWKGGLGIWGAIAAGTLGAYIACRRRGISLRTFADAAAPGIALAQALGRWGNWFNQELYGRPSKLPWAVEIDPAHRVNTPDVGTYHPTFLYESLWCIGVAVLVIWAEKRFRLAYGRTFALYVAAYTVGRAWIEWLRVDSAHHILGLRLNDWTSLIVFLAAVAYLYFYRGRTEIPEGAVGSASTGPETEAGTPAGESAETAEESEKSSTTAKDADTAAENPADKTSTPEDPQTPATDDEPAKTAEPAKAAKPEDTAGESPAEPAAASEADGEPAETAEPAKAEPADTAAVAASEADGEPATADGPKASGGEPEKPGDAALEATEPAEPEVAEPAAESEAAEPAEAGEVAPTAGSNGHGAVAESADANGHAAATETGTTDEPGESAAADEAGQGEDDGKAKASTAAEPGKRKP